MARIGRTDADALPALVRYQCRAFLVTVVYTTVTVRRFAPPRLARFCQPLPCSHSHKTTTRKAFLMIIFLKFIYFVVVFRWNHGNRASSKRNYQKIKIYLFFTLIQRISLIPKLDFQIYWAWRTLRQRSQYVLWAQQNRCGVARGVTRACRWSPSSSGEFCSLRRKGP